MFYVKLTQILLPSKLSRYIYYIGYKQRQSAIHYMLNFIVLICSFIYGFGQEYNDEPVKISDFTLPNVVSGNSFSLSEFSEAKAVVVVFTSHYCPYAKLYEDRIFKLIEKYQGQEVRFLLINSNNPQKSAPDSRENMIKMANLQKIKVPYLSDSQQEVANMFGASKTPEVFLLKKAKGSFEILYQGAIDDNPQVASDVSHFFLNDAIEAVLKGRRPTQVAQRPTGCMIKR